MDKHPEITELVNISRLGSNAEEARAALLPLIYNELKKIAVSLIFEPGQTLTSTVLVHEAFHKLFLSKNSNTDLTAHQIADRKHFYALAAKAMRQIQIDEFRTKSAEKRFGGQTRVDLEDAVQIAATSEQGPDDRIDFIALDRALDELAILSPTSAKLVELRYFGGLSLPDVAEVLGISLSSAKREWIFSKAWLYRKLHHE